MKLSSFYILSASILALAGCSSTPTKVDTGPIRARTFSFVGPSTKPSPAYADNRQMIHPLVQDAIKKNLAARGVTHVASGGDIVVAYLIITGNNASTTSISDYFGYTEDDTALQEKAQKAYTSSKHPGFFEAGTLIIDLIDPQASKLLKRGYATRQILRNLPEDARAARVQEVVDQILHDLRITQ
jgi:hypothetical protein